MKKFLFLIVILFSINFISACDCEVNTLAQNYIKNAVAAEVTVLNTYGNNATERTYKADVKFEIFFKGSSDKNTLTIQGEIGNIVGTACDLKLEKGKKYLIFLNNDNEIISACNAHYDLGNNNNSYQSKINALENLFSFLKNNTTKNDEFVFYFEKNRKGKSKISKLKNFAPKNNFAVYEVILNNEKQIEKVNIVSEFGDHDSKICELIKSNLVPNFSHNQGKRILISFIYIPEYIGIKYKDHITSDLY